MCVASVKVSAHATLASLGQRFFLAFCLVWLGSFLPEQASAAPDKVFNVKDYGALADGAHDDQIAIRKALDAAGSWTASGPENHATVYFPAGTYNLTHMYGIYAINIKGMRNITLSGEGGAENSVDYKTKLIGAPATYYPQRDAANYNSFFSVSQSNNIEIRNFYLDKMSPYFTQGIVHEVDPKGHSIDVRMDPGYHDFSDPFVAHLLNLIWFFSDVKSNVWDHGESACAAPPLLANNNDRSCFNTHIVSQRLIAPGLWHLDLDKPPSPAFANRPFLMWKNLGWQPGILVDHSHDVTIANIFYTGGGGPGVHIGNSDGRNIMRNVSVDVPSGSGRLFAATSGFNGVANRGSIELDKVRVAHVDDDAFHFLAGTYFPILDGQKGGDHMRVALCYEGNFRPGDEISLWDWNAKKEVSRAHVLSAAVVQDLDAPKYPRTCDLVLDRPLGPVHHTRTYDPKMIGRLTDENDRIANNSLNATLTVQNSFLSSMRARCGIIQVSGRVENNTCRDTVLAGFLVGPEFSWGEGYSVNNLAIRNNKFVNIGGAAIYLANIGDSNRMVSYEKFIGGPAPTGNTAQTNTNISIVGNAFSGLGHFTHGTMGFRGVAISVENAQNVTIENNQIDESGIFQKDSATSIAISRYTTTNVVVRDNNVLSGLPGGVRPR